MQFHEALLQVYKVGAKIRAVNGTDKLAYIKWSGKFFVDQNGRALNPDLNYSMNQDWEVIVRRQGPFCSFKPGEKVQLFETFGKVFTVIEGHPKYNAITSEGLCVYISQFYWVYHQE